MRMRLSTGLLAAFFMACGGDAPRQLPVGTRYGGVFNLNETEALRSIFPLTLTQASAFRIMAQVYQGLVAFDPMDLKVVPGLAERWEVDATGTIYTFHLREGVRFHDNAVFNGGIGRDMTADDVIHCFNAICTQGLGDGAFWLFQDRVVGANQHYADKAPVDHPVKGIERLDDHSVRITLTRAVPNFLQIVAHQGCWIWPHELVGAHGADPRIQAVGTGPFRLKAYQPSEVMVMERWSGYWGKAPDGGPLPYLDAVRITFNEDKNQEFNQFLNGHVSALLELPVERLRDLADSVSASGEQRFTMQARPSLTSQFYGFDRSHRPFNDVRVRRAFAMAIDRRFLVDSVLGGFASPALHGLVAPGLASYPYDRVPTIPFAPDSARHLLAEAGFPGGAGFPPLQLQVNADGFGYVRVAEAVQVMLERELHVPLSISVMPAGRHYDRVDRGEVRFWREGWTADHPDAENFLALLYGKNAVLDSMLPASINKARYANPTFDALFAKAADAKDEGKRNAELAQAESVAMADMPVVPLYHERGVYLLRPEVRNLTLNAIEYLDLQGVWLERATAP